MKKIYIGEGRGGAKASPKFSVLPADKAYFDTKKTKSAAPKKKTVAEVPEPKDDVDHLKIVPFKDDE